MKRFLVILAACAPEPAPITPVTPPDPLVGHWTIADHIMSPNPEITDGDAAAMHGRVVDITAGGYTTPWHGACGEAGRTATPQLLANIEVIHNLGDAQNRFKFLPDVVEYVLTCVDNKRAPPLTVYLGNNQGLTCWAGACYLLTRGR